MTMMSTTKARILPTSSSSSTTNSPVRAGGRIRAAVATYRQELTAVARFALPLLLMALVALPTATFAAGSVDTSKLKAGADSIIAAIQSVCIIAVPLLAVAGFSTLMYSGFSENFKRIGIRIIGFLFVGAIGLFLFAQPLADLLTSAVGQGGGQ